MARSWGTLIGPIDVLYAGLVVTHGELVRNNNPLIINEPLIIAVDPGGTTGLATYSREVGLRTMQGPPYDIIKWVDDSIGVGAIGLIICESFTIGQGTLKKSREGSNTAIETIGVIRWLAYRAGVGFRLQSPAEAKGFSTNLKLRAVGWYDGIPEHARDAARHLLLACVREGLVSAESVIPPNERGMMGDGKGESIGVS